MYPEGLARYVHAIGTAFRHFRYYFEYHALILQSKEPLRYSLEATSKNSSDNPPLTTFLHPDPKSRLNKTILRKTSKERTEEQKGG